MKKYIPNAVTLSRAALAPLIAYLIITGSEHIASGSEDAFALRVAALIIMIIAELTDALDGFLARKLEVVSSVGKVLDPFADSLYRFTVFAAFFASGYMPIWTLLVFFYRDSLASFLRILSALKGTAMAARMSGKVKAVVQATAVFLVMAMDLLRINPWENPDLPYDRVIFISFIAAAGYTFYSGIDYLIGSYKFLGKKS